MSRANFVQVQLAQAATDVQTTLVVNAPVGGFVAPLAAGGRLVLTDSPGRPMAFEVISYTGRTGAGPYTLTGVVRGLEGTAGLGWSIDAYVMQALTVGELDLLLGAKVDKASGQSLMLNDERTKLAGIAAGAQVNTVSSVAGRTGAVTLVKADVGLGSVDNTSDANKPVSTAQAAALAGKQGAHVNLTALANLSGAADRLPYFTGAGALSLVTLTSLARNLLDDTTQSGMQNTLGLVKQTSATDTTAGSLLTVGAFGLGGPAPVLPTNDYNELTDYNGFARSNNAIPATNAPAGLVQNPLSVINCRFSGTYGWQMAGLANGAVPSNASLRFFLRHEVNNSWSDWAEIFHSRNILGTVSQSAGVPTGALFERGSNANGRYERLASGTQECISVLFSGTLTAGQAVGIDVPFAAVFAASPDVAASNYTQSGTEENPTFIQTSIRNAPGVSSCRAVVRNSHPTLTLAYNVSVIAKGRWF